MLLMDAWELAVYVEWDMNVTKSRCIFPLDAVLHPSRVVSAIQQQEAAASKHGLCVCLLGEISAVVQGVRWTALGG